MTTPNKYTPLPIINSKSEAELILKEGDPEVLGLLGMAVGDQCPEFEKKFAQDLCIRLTEFEDERIRANAVLGLAYIARRHKWLDKRIVKPVILKELRENKEYNWRIVDSIKDINTFLDWNLARKHI